MRRFRLTEKPEKPPRAPERHRRTEYAQAARRRAFTRWRILKFIQEMRRIDNNTPAPFERLLRSHLKAASTSSDCSGFDADLATSYLEHALPAATRQWYENHLLECYDCRKTVASLSLAYEEEALTGADQRRIVEAPAGLGFLSLFATPKWALAAAALLIALISIPVILNLNDRKPSVALSEESSTPNSLPGSSSPVAEAGPAKTTITPLDSARGAQTTTAVPASSPSSTNGAAAGGAGVSGTPKPVESSGRSAADARPAPAVGAVRELDRNAEEKKNEVAASAKSETAQPVSQPEARQGERSEAVSDTQVKNGRADLPKVDTAKALSLPEDKGKSGEVKTLRRGTVGDAARSEKERTATVKPLGPVTPSPSENQGSDSTVRAGISAPPPSGRDKDNKKVSASSDTRMVRAAELSAAKPAKPEERRVSNKTFRLISGVWTDKSYKPDKEIPVVPLTWDTDVYKEMLLKQAGLKPYFAGFQTGERVIVVYKGTIYKISPLEK
ncbi:MAG: hypothetical protein DMF61_09170 [Blastocatellia bacterium AA13]|nr:MAG: hypothetical protein DMF61_09170 [Blastocatellia bacterium AA13]